MNVQVYQSRMILMFLCGLLAIVSLFHNKYLFAMFFMMGMLICINNLRKFDPYEEYREDDYELVK